MRLPKSIAASNITIVGLGLMGGSMALALRGRCHTLSGCDIDPTTLDLAQRWNLADGLSPHPKDALAGADVIILAAPVRRILAYLQDLPALFEGQALVLDLGSTKAQILQAMAQLPDRLDPIGGHPMCGKETSSLAHAEAGLYQGAPFALSALERSSPQARSLAEEIVRLIGARPLWIDAGLHDAWTAATSHLPYLVASALVRSIQEDAQPLIGPGFRSTSRLAGSDLTMMTDILLTNRERVLEALDRFQGRLSNLQDAIRSDDEADLVMQLHLGKQRYENLVAPGQERKAANR